jgi:hypothetical protein
MGEPRPIPADQNAAFAKKTFEPIELLLQQARPVKI